jgi:hypothetical protein
MRSVRASHDLMLSSYVPVVSEHVVLAPQIDVDRPAGAKLNGLIDYPPPWLVINLHDVAAVDLERGYGLGAHAASVIRQRNHPLMPQTVCVARPELPMSVRALCRPP